MNLAPDFVSRHFYIEDIMSATDRPLDRYKIDKDIRSADRLGEGIEQMVKSNTVLCKFACYCI